MLGKGHFEGDYRTKPVVSIRGASKQETRTQLLERAQIERADREAKRLEVQSAIKIQSLVRGFLVRRRVHRACRQHEMPKLKKQYDSNTKNLILLKQICRLIIFSNDTESVNWVCMALVKERESILPQLGRDRSWIQILSQICEFCVKFIRDDRAGTSIAPCLRVFETFASASKVEAAVLVKIYTHLVNKGYYSHMKHIINTRVPPIIEECTRPPNPMSEQVIMMVLNPIVSLNDSKDNRLKRQVFLSLLKEVFSDDLSEQVKLFVLPYTNSCPAFMFSDLISVLDTGGDLGIPPTPGLLYSLLYLSRGKLGDMDRQQESAFLSVISYIVRNTIIQRSWPKYRLTSQMYEEDSSDDESMEVNDPEEQLINECVKCLNSQEFIACMIKIVRVDSEEDVDVKMEEPSSSSTAMSFGSGSSFSTSGASAFGTAPPAHHPGPAMSEPMDRMTVQNIRNLCKICHHLLLRVREGIQEFQMIKAITLGGKMLPRLWKIICTTSQPSLFGSPTPLVSILSRGLRISTEDRNEIAPLLTVFCSSFSYLLFAIDDHDFFGTADAEHRWMPFSVPEVVSMTHVLRDLTLGLIDLGFPESRPAMDRTYKDVVSAFTHTGIEDEDKEGMDVYVWSHIFRKVYSLMKLLYYRDTRHQFCPTDHWISSRVCLPDDKMHDIQLRGARLVAHMPFRGLRVLTRDDMEESGPPLTTKEARLAMVLRCVPFLISFSSRVQLFQKLIQRDKQDYQGERVNFMQGPAINIVVRRDYIYEDAFEKLSPENERNLKLKMRVQLINAAGLDEAGIDGGGVFREFLSQLIKSAFDPNRGFFVLTRDQLLYPNPSVHKIHQNYAAHYFFIGRVIGKALYENLLVELPLAGFFLHKLLIERANRLDIGVDYLNSLDPELYKNLMYLKNYKGDVSDLGLDFTVNVEEFGKTKVELLKPEGDKIPVTERNRLEYIYKVADFKLNRQIKEQCLAFRRGLYDVVGLDWLRMFSDRELATLLSGAEHDINIEDLKVNTNYAGGFDPDHPTILAFWKVVHSFSEDDKRSLLKFVTSCSRPPLLGFRDLDPPFCIQNAGNEDDRLPTASTCMNLLKLPDFKTEDILKKKLSYAIHSGAGFELS